MTDTVYRTFLELDPYHDATRGLLIDAQKAHRLTMTPFAWALEHKDFFTGNKTGHPDHRASQNILWAVNYTQHTHPALLTSTPPRVRMILQSDIAPHFDYWRCQEWSDALMHTPNVREHKLTQAEGSTIEYQIVVNPRRNVTIHGVRKTIIPSRDNELNEWWLQKTATIGLTLTTSPTIDQPGTLQSDAKPLAIRHFRLTGKATITDPTLFTEAAHKGVGSARAYGCGLLLTK